MSLSGLLPESGTEDWCSGPRGYGRKKQHRGGTEKLGYPGLLRLTFPCPYAFCINTPQWGSLWGCGSYRPCSLASEVGGNCALCTKARMRDSRSRELVVQAMVCLLSCFQSLDWLSLLLIDYFLILCLIDYLITLEVPQRFSSWMNESLILSVPKSIPPPNPRDSWVLSELLRRQGDIRGISLRLELFSFLSVTASERWASCVPGKPKVFQFPWVVLTPCSLFSYGPGSLVCSKSFMNIWLNGRREWVDGWMGEKSNLPTGSWNGITWFQYQMRRQNVDLLLWKLKIMFNSFCPEEA